jgi:uncharacterized membrane protein YphA (DoxX/SURF4 family)
MKKTKHSIMKSNKKKSGGASGTLSSTIQTGLGLIFLFSGIFKAIDAQEFARIISGYGFVWAGYISPMIAGVEVILGLCLIFRIFRNYTAITTLSVTAVFTFLFLYGFFFRGITDCGCMGPFITIPPIISLARNILILIGSYWLWKRPDSSQIIPSNLKLWVIYIVGSLTFVLAGYTLNKPIISKNKIESGQRVGQTFLKPFSHIIGKGLSFVFIFDTNCIKCWNASANVKSIKSISAFNNTIAITLPQEYINDYVQRMQPNFNIYRYPTPEIYSVIKQYPVLLMIQNGIIAQVFNSGEIPSGPILEDMLRHQQNIGN